MTLAEKVADLRAEIERLLPPGWKVWVRLDICDFQFFGWKDSIKNCVQSPYYTDSHIPNARDVSEFMESSLEYMDYLKKTT